MIWLQSGLCLLLWLGYGVVQSRRSETIRARVATMSRGQRAITGAGLMAVAAIVLIGGLAIVLTRGGFTSVGMTPTAWLVTAALGLAFVHAQTMAAAMLVTLVQDNVTKRPESTSLNRTPRDSS